MKIVILLLLFLTCSNDEVYKSKLILNEHGCRFYSFEYEDKTIIYTSSVDCGFQIVEKN